MEQKQNLVEIINRMTALNKAGVQTIAERIVMEYESGNVDTEEFTEKLEFMLQSIEAAMAVIREKETDKILRKYGDRLAREGVKTKNGNTLKVKEVGVKYDYSNTPRWVELQNDMDAIANKRKALETQLKAITKPQQLLDEETGELHTYNPAIRSSKTSLEISIKKS